MALLDARGNPIRPSDLTREVAAATVGGIRSPMSGYPGDGLNPVRLAQILRAADAGDPVRYLELAETVEERDPHYLGVLGTRRRSVAQLELKVEAASDAAADIEQADMIRDWLTRDELSTELFDILDCIGKGVSFTEIVWTRTGGRWWPERLEWRDPRWFRWDRTDLTTPLLLTENGAEVPLPGFKFIHARIAAKSGLPLRSGIARLAAWGWMFKAFTARDWAIFTQTYGQPLRLGRFGAGASEEDKETLFRAVANIAGDCAAIIPESMGIDFIEPKSLTGASDLYERRADWLDRQISKAVLGQTTSTDAIAGGHAVSREHRLVQEDIERADARTLAAILNRDLIRPWIQLQYGPQTRYPRLTLTRPDIEDTTRLAETLSQLVPLGLRVQASEVRDRMGFADPDAGAEVLMPLVSGFGMMAARRPQEGVEGPSRGYPDTPRTAALALHQVPQFAAGAPGADTAGADRFLKGAESRKKGGVTPSCDDAPSGAEGPSAGRSAAVSAQARRAAPGVPDAAAAHMEALAARAEAEMQPEVVRLIGQVEAMLGAAGSLEEARAMLLAAYPELDVGGLALALARGVEAAELAGRVAIEEAAAAADGADG